MFKLKFVYLKKKNKTSAYNVIQLTIECCQTMQLIKILYQMKNAQTFFSVLNFSLVHGQFN